MSVEIPTINIKIEQLEEDEKLEVGNICKLLKKISDSKHMESTLWVAMFIQSWFKIVLNRCRNMLKFQKIDFDFGKSTQSLIKGISGETKSVYSK